MDQRETRCDCVGCAVSDAATAISLDEAHQRTEWTMHTPINDTYDDTCHARAEADQLANGLRAQYGPTSTAGMTVVTRTTMALPDGATLTTPWTKEPNP